MRFFNFKSTKSKEDILWKFNRLRALEQHKIFAYFWESYNDYRIGLHTYVDGDKVRGYYEDGGLSRDSLVSAKIWFYGRISERNGECHFRGIIVSSTIILEIIGIIYFIYYLSPIEPVEFVLSLLYIFYVIYRERAVYECIKEIMS